MKTSCAVYMLCSAGPNRLLQVLMLWYRAPAVLLGAANYSNAIDIWKPGGFGFFQFLDPADPVGSKYQMDGQVVQARQLTVLFAEENRKKAADMQTREFRYNEREHSSTYLFKGFEKVGASHRWSLGPKERGTPNQTKFSQVAVVAVICVHPEPSYILLITDVLHSLIPLVPAEIGGSPRA